MQVREFRLLGATQLATAQERATRLAADWTREWLRDGLQSGMQGAPYDGLSGGLGIGQPERVPPAQVQVRSADSVPLLPGPWITQRLGQACCHVQCQPGLIERLLFGALAVQQPSELAGEVAHSALADLARRCLPGAGAPLQSSDAPDAAQWLRGSGALHIGLEMPEGQIQWLLNGAAARHWLAATRAKAARSPSPRLHDLHSAIGHGRLRLAAWTGQAEIDFATLQSLAVGDVIALDLRIDQPLCLSVDKQPATRRAYLGSRDGRRALRLSSDHDPL